MHLTARPVPVDPLFAPLTEGNERATPNRSWWVVAAIAGVVALGVQIFIMWGSTTPTFPFDEVNLLQMSRVIAGVGAPEGTGHGYFPGWSVLLAPLWWIFKDPEDFYRAGLVLGIVVAMVTALPLAALGRRVGLHLPQALTGAFLVLSMPSRTVQADFLLSERLLFLVIACTAVAVWRAWERPTPWRAAVVGLLAAAAYFTHLRALVIVAATVVWLLLFLRRSWRSALAGLATLAVATYVAQRVGDALNVAIIGDSPGQSDSFLQSLRNSTPILMAKVGVAQAWEQIVASFGLAAIGLLVVVMVAWHGIRRLQAQPMVWVFGVLLVIAAVSVVSWSDPGPLTDASWMRLDVWIYGRYLDPIVALLVMFALSVMMLRMRRWIAWSALAIHAAVAAVTLVWIAPGATTWGYVTPAHIPGVMPWYILLPRDSTVDTAMLPTLTNANSFWAWASLTSLVVHAMLVLMRRRTELIAATLVAVLGFASILSDASTDIAHDNEDGPVPVLDLLKSDMQATGATSVVYDGSCAEGRTSMSAGFNYFGWWMLPSIMDVSSSAETDLSSWDVVIGCPDWPEADAYGARSVTGSIAMADLGNLGSIVWVMPGELQDRLAAEGRLD
ncbi:hypothetical protein RN607_13410 [Demequina capsici]|uniref:Uncharacterized protein n=1 Tax=Demequina capsici TaxID=3075620 RepID=A0AA96FBL0_9MICO|nr:MULTISPECIES: hypothetical protein [unclassified Demequina]WNM24361.1 hypothetical protein RN606_13505 [Demequina sp. OYTSA14]WNM27183.1 hypothetical protein RN607_13410 [Demequina sp. PMTSA13]